MSLKEQGYSTGLCQRQKLVGIKAPVFSMSKLPGVDTYLGPEMKSTGEVMGISKDFGTAFAKALAAAGGTLPSTGTVFISVNDYDKGAVIPHARALAEGFRSTDDSALVERLGCAIRLVRGSRENLKITTPADVMMAELLLARREPGR